MLTVFHKKHLVFNVIIAAFSPPPSPFLYISSIKKLVLAKIAAYPHYMMQMYTVHCISKDNIKQYMHHITINVVFKLLCNPRNVVTIPKVSLLDMLGLPYFTSSPLHG